jgi:lantibiotic biosynthesis protein
MPLQLCERAVESLQAAPRGCGFLNGSTGVAWAIEHLAAIQGIDIGGVNDEVDCALLEVVGRESWRYQYDLFAGLIGLGIYAGERSARSGERSLFTLVIESLEACADVGPVGLVWKIDPRIAQCPEDDCAGPYVNMGLAHGMASIIAFLSYASTLTPVQPRALALLGGAVEWFVSHRCADSCLHAFPMTIGVREPGAAGATVPPIASWCYGDMGISTALSRAAVCLEDASLSQLAVTIGLRAAGSTSPRGEHGICHGTAGTAHMLNRLYQQTGDERLRLAAVHWYRQLHL